MNDAGQNVTRLAPSPTGALHLGNARTFMINWAIARQRDWSIVMRIEDLDSPRVKQGADVQAVDDLRWLGMDWDAQVPHQLSDLTPYHDALAKLRHARHVYACTCSRREIEQAQSAPHEDDHELRYPGTCRGRSGFGFRVSGSTEPSFSAKPEARNPRPDTPATRVIVPDEPIDFVDQIVGPQSINVQQQVGDFVVATKAGLPAYQLAVVVDDARQHITDVVRGDDLLGSTARQLLLYHLLELPAPKRWWHLPLVIGEDGKRLAKRHGDTRIASYREAGVRPRRVIGLLAQWCGILPSRGEMSAAEFVERFDLTALPRQAVTFTQEDHAWLVG